MVGGTYTTVSTVSAPSLLRGLVDLDVLDDQVARVEALGVGVGLGVLEETEKDLGGLDRPAGPGDAQSLACGSQPYAQTQHCPSSDATRRRKNCCSSTTCQYTQPVTSRSSCALTLRSASSAASVPPHGDSLLVLQDIAEVGEGALEFPAVDGLGRLAGVLEGDAEVAAASASRLCAVDAGGSVANLAGSISLVLMGCRGAPTPRLRLSARPWTYHFVVRCWCC